MHTIETYLATTPWRTWQCDVASADASFRRYFRLTHQNQSVILMDASLEKASLKPFVEITARLLSAGVHAPKIFDANLEAGFLILEDFGSSHYLNILNADNYHALYTRAMQEIVTMQHVDVTDLPLYDRSFLLHEMQLMPEWFLHRYLHLHLNTFQSTMLEQSLHDIATEVLAQPQGLFVHRDFHSRNIMLSPSGTIGVIDYQDAMNGALTYDLISLLKDCYIAFNPQEIDALALTFRDMAKISADDATFLRWCDFTSMQRHIKVLGIFCRLYLRDGKRDYLKDLPLTLKYLIRSTKKYQKTEKLATLLEKITLPNITKEFHEVG